MDKYSAIVKSKNQGSNHKQNEAIEKVRIKKVKKNKIRNSIFAGILISAFSFMGDLVSVMEYFKIHNPIQENSNKVSTEIDALKKQEIAFFVSRLTTLEQRYKNFIKIDDIERIQNDLLEEKCVGIEFYNNSPDLVIFSLKENRFENVPQNFEKLKILLEENKEVNFCLLSD